MRQLSEEDEAMKEKYFNDTLVDVNILNRTTATPRRRQSTQLSNDETITDDVDALLSLLQDLGDERDLLLNDESDAADDRRSRRDEQDELDTLEMSQIVWDVDPFADLSSGDDDDDEEDEGEEVSKSENEDIWDKSFWQNVNLEDLD